jgi:catechol 2,3-dioxygenase-like lactoylglutathione lyase family enzyme
VRKRLLISLGVALALVAALVGGLVVATRTGPDPASGLHLTGVLHVNINCSDFERSRAFYEMLGFRVLMDVEQNASPQAAAAVGMESYAVRGALMAHRDGSVIDLLEWREPRDERPPYDRLNHLGLARIAFTTTDIMADIARLTDAGVQFLSEAPAEVPDPLGGTTRFICFEDPDGTVLELVQMGTVMGIAQRASQLARGGS